MAAPIPREMSRDAARPQPCRERAKKFFRGRRSAMSRAVAPRFFCRRQEFRRRGERNKMRLSTARRGPNGATTWSPGPQGHGPRGRSASRSVLRDVQRRRTRKQRPDRTPTSAGRVRRSRALDRWFAVAGVPPIPPADTFRSLPACRSRRLDEPQSKSLDVAGAGPARISRMPGKHVLGVSSCIGILSAQGHACRRRAAGRGVRVSLGVAIRCSRKASAPIGHRRCPRPMAW